jgi:hypothetical protein
MDTIKLLPQMKFTAPTSGSGNDWVLIIDNAEKEFAAPGK